MKQIVFATNNAHKLDELRGICAGKLEVLSLKQAGVDVSDLEETSDTLRGNALQKARQVKALTGLDCFADDTGLMVDALGGEPGVRSARYAPGDGHDSQANMRLLLKNMSGLADRRAHFVTEIALLEGDAEPRFFTGRVDGTIGLEPVGEEGFGYDPLFMPDEAEGLSFAQMTPEAKNAISHRGRATRLLLNYLLKR